MFSLWSNISRAWDCGCGIHFVYCAYISGWLMNQNKRHEMKETKTLLMGWRLRKSIPESRSQAFPVTATSPYNKAVIEEPPKEVTHTLMNEGPRWESYTYRQSGSEDNLRLCAEEKLGWLYPPLFSFGDRKSTMAEARLPRVFSMTVVRIRVHFYYSPFVGNLLFAS